MSLVTIDDRITRLMEHSVSIEVVERVDRTCFYTAGSPTPLGHVDENVFWVRGQHTLDSNEVKAARAAVALGDKLYEDQVMRRELDEARRHNDEALQSMLSHGMVSNPMPIPGPAPSSDPSYVSGVGTSSRILKAMHRKLHGA